MHVRTNRNERPHGTEVGRVESGELYGEG